MPCIVLVVTVAALAARGRCAAADMGVVERPGVIGLSLDVSLSVCVCVRVCVRECVSVAKGVCTYALGVVWA